MNDSKLHMAVAALLLAVAMAWSAVRGPSRDPYDELVSSDRDRVASALFKSGPVAEGGETESDQVADQGERGLLNALAPFDLLD